MSDTECGCEACGKDAEECDCLGWEDDEITCPECRAVWFGSPYRCEECLCCGWVHYTAPIGPKEAPCPDCYAPWDEHCSVVDQLRAENAQLKASAEAAEAEAGRLRTENRPLWDAGAWKYLDLVKKIRNQRAELTAQQAIQVKYKRAIEDLEHDRGVALRRWKTEKARAEKAEAELATEREGRAQAEEVAYQRGLGDGADCESRGREGYTCGGMPEYGVAAVAPNCPCVSGSQTYAERKAAGQWGEA